LAAFVISLAIPAITSQWSDRQKELELKDKLVSQFTSSAATAIENADGLVDDETRGGELPADSLRSRWASISSGWKVAAYTLESELAAYYPDAKLRGDNGMSFQDAFDEYNERVQQFIYLGFNDCRDGRVGRLELLSRYLGFRKHGDVWKALDTDAEHKVNCWRRTGDFKAAYVGYLSSLLLEKRADLVDTVIHSSAAGFNDSFGDFVRQIVPFA
jgi:hypothetical protein